MLFKFLSRLIFILSVFSCTLIKSNKEDYFAKWVADDEQFIDRYEIEQGIDSLHFITIAKITPAGKHQYSYKLPRKPNYYYRVKSISGDLVFYTPVIYVK